jgi:hypothetical protein
MLPDPLHPAVVHLPLALALLVPALAILCVIAIRGSFLPQRAWLGVVILQVLFVGSAWLALETGEDQEDRVEKVLAERHIEEHEEEAERFLYVGVAGLLVASAGLLSGVAGRLGRGATVVVTLAVLAAGIPVGHSGGELVYKYGAANAYIQEGVSGAVEREAEAGHHDDDDDD